VNSANFLSVMTFGAESDQTSCRSILDLPEDVVYVLLSYCDLRSLGRLAQVCRVFHFLVKQDLVWVRLRRRLTCVKDYTKSSRHPDDISVAEQCRIAINWAQGKCRDKRLIHHRVKQLPWLQLTDQNLWISYSNIVKCYTKKRDGRLQEHSHKTIRGQSGDVTKFVVRDGVLVSGSRDGSIQSHCCETGNRISKLKHCHTSDIHSVDFHTDVIVSGSRDATVKLWRMQDDSCGNALLHDISAEDRVWSVAMNPNGGTFIMGTAGINHVPPLRVWDTATAQLLGALGCRYKYGAGVLDIQFESPNTLLSCGYDTYVRMWDLRASYNHCVMMWEEPFDSTIYCVKSDNDQTFVSGTARHGMARLWDKRAVNPVKCYYVGKTNSPVYSLAFDPKRLYVALDKGINLVDYSIK